MAEVLHEASAAPGEKYPPQARLIDTLARAGLVSCPKVIAGLLERLTCCEGLLLPESPQRVRFVHVSDTHGLHRRVHVPEGDVLVHTGDLTGNYATDANLLPHLRDVVAWLAELAQRFSRVILIAGNHDTLLDDRGGSHQLDEARRVLEALPSNCIYLDGESGNGMVEYRGLHIWGCPVTVSRLETLSKRYVSNAFERTFDVRQRVWDRIPEGLDVLLTHAPPAGVLSRDGVGCSALLARLRAMRRPPRLHCFGHDHTGIGVDLETAPGLTGFLNAGQLDVLWAEDYVGQKLGGCALIFDLREKRSEVENSAQVG